jgi:hypothetical protein
MIYNYDHQKYTKKDISFILKNQPQEMLMIKHKGKITIKSEHKILNLYI